MVDEVEPKVIARAHHEERYVSDGEALAHIPTDPTDQSCAACSSSEVAWVHPLAVSRTKFRVFGKGWTLPSYWWLCADCEEIYQAGDDAELVRRSAGNWREGLPPGHWYPRGERSFTDEEYYEQMFEQPFAVFRRSDMGPHRVQGEQ